MVNPCPRCKRTSPEGARFCATCGLFLGGVSAGEAVAGRIHDPRATGAPPGFTACERAADLYYRCDGPWGGGVLLGTEGATIEVRNTGYPLTDVVLRIRGEDADGRVLFALEREIASLPRGQTVAVEVASYEVSAPYRALKVSLASAVFALEA
jgi:hypothetical protein